MKNKWDGQRALRFPCDMPVRRKVSTGWLRLPRVPERHEARKGCTNKTELVPNVPVLPNNIASVPKVSGEGKPPAADRIRGEKEVTGNTTSIILCNERIGEGPRHVVGRAVIYDAAGKSEVIVCARGATVEEDEIQFVLGRCKRELLRRGLSMYPISIIDNTGLSADKDRIR